MDGRACLGSVLTTGFIHGLGVTQKEVNEGSQYQGLHDQLVCEMTFLRQALQVVRKMMSCHSEVPLRQPQEGLSLTRRIIVTQRPSDCSD